MEKLDEFFKSLIGERNGKSDLEILEEIEGYLQTGGVDEAIAQLKNLEKEQNIFLALRMIMRSIVSQLDELNQLGTITQEDLQKVHEKVKELIPIVNTVFNSRYRALLMADLSVLFYCLNDELNGDMALRTAIDLARNHDDVLRDIMMCFIRKGLLNKAGYAIKMVREPEKLNVVLVQLAEMFYRAGDMKKARLIIDHIASPFHKTMAFYYIAAIEAEHNKEEALKILDAAFQMAEKVKDPEARFELTLKLYELKHSILGNTFSLKEILSRKGGPPQ
ncbi:hypothetical protein [Thermococcus piezophilus]|uniref:Tetratricopeptide repeat protein n=1 Tax=Thermococcus piezophilus TaxID=1712654 RepID=A0A172WI10_9EURY|nr:hypothetical protein [Thermococcus piezophilus]ANF23087.1 hypothetical protein A7C91_07850 [Thermococcus piezophilus]